MPKKNLRNEAIKLESFYQGQALQHALSALLSITECDECVSIEYAKKTASDTISKCQVIFKENLDKQRELFDE